MIYTHIYISIYILIYNIYILVTKKDIKGVSFHFLKNDRVQFFKEKGIFDKYREHLKGGQFTP